MFKTCAEVAVGAFQHGANFAPDRLPPILGVSSSSRCVLDDPSELELSSSRLKLAGGTLTMETTRARPMHTLRSHRKQQCSPRFPCRTSSPHTSA